MITTALNTSVTSGGMPATYTVVVSVCRISAPTSVPEMEYRPPVSSVPPRTTARIASSSIHSPALLASAAVTLELIIRPARPAQTATKT